MLRTIQSNIEYNNNLYKVKLEDTSLHWHKPDIEMVSCAVLSPFLNSTVYVFAEEGVHVPESSNDPKHKFYTVKV